MNNKYFEINELGHNVRCKLYYDDIHSIKKVVVYGHGFGGHKDNKAAENFAERLISKYKGFALIAFNLPAHGDDVKKKITLSDCVLYFDLVTKYAKETLNADELYSYATSFGGYLTLLYILEKGNPFSKVALRCPAVNMYDVLMNSIVRHEEAEKLAKGKDAEIGFDRKILINQSFLDDLKVADIASREFFDYADDILIMHGTKDEIVPMDFVKDFAENNVIEFIPIENADHRFQDKKTMETATKAITHFYGLS